MNIENKKNPTECPEESELQSYLEGDLGLMQMESVEHHITFCDRCYLMLKVLEPSDDEGFEDEEYEIPQKLPEWMVGHGRELDERQKNIEAKKRSLEQVLSNGGIKFAQVWEPKTDGILLVTPDGNQNYSFVDFNSVPHFVVVIDDDKDAEKIQNHRLVRAFPIHDEEDLIKEDDLLLKKENSPTGYSFSIQSWNPCKILVDNLDVCIGEIRFQEQEDLAKQLKNLAKKQQANWGISFPNEEKDIPNIGISKKVFAKNFKTDPLIRYRYKEFKETAYLRVPAESLRETAELQKAAPESILEKLWNLIPTYLLAPRLVPIGVGLLLFIIVGGWLVFFSRKQINDPLIAEVNKNTALPTIPDMQSNQQNINVSNSSNANSSEDLNTDSSNKNGNEKTPNNENRENTNSPRNRTKETKGDSLNIHKEELKKQGEQKKEQQNQQRRQIQPTEQPQLYAQKEDFGQETIKIEEDIIKELPPPVNTNTRSSSSDTRNFFLSPNGTSVKTKPKFRWSSYPGAEKYWVGIYDYRDNIVAGVFVDGNTWTSNIALAPGQSYRWKVIPVDKKNKDILIGDQPLQGSFRVLNNAQQQQVAKVEESVESPSLKLARIYLRNALFEDAIRELETFLLYNPETKEAKRLLDLAKNPQKLVNSKKN